MVTFLSYAFRTVFAVFFHGVQRSHGWALRSVPDFLISTFDSSFPAR